MQSFVFLGSLLEKKRGFEHFFRSSNLLVKNNERFISINIYKQLLIIWDREYEFYEVSTIILYPSPSLFNKISIVNRPQKKRKKDEM